MALKKKSNRTQQEPPKIIREVAAIAWLGGAILTLLALVSYNPNDLSMFSTHPNDPPVNFIGIGGAGWAWFLFLLFGLGGYFVPLLFVAAGLAMLLHNHFFWRWKLLWAGIFLISATSLLHLQSWLGIAWAEEVKTISPGGLVGQLLDDYLLTPALGHVGTGLILGALYLGSLILLFELHPRTAWAQLIFYWKLYRAKRAEARVGNDPVARKQAEKESLERKQKELEKQLAEMKKKQKKPSEAPSIPAEPEMVSLPEVIDTSLPTPRKKESSKKEKESIHLTSSKASQEPALPSRSSRSVASMRHAGESSAEGAFDFEHYVLPSIDLLTINEATGTHGMNEAELRANAELLVRTLKEFGISAHAGPITKGATITRYELIPASGVRVHKIKGLKNDIARVMKAEKVNILAPIPGKDSVGVEVANHKKVPIVLRDLLESDLWIKKSAKIPLAVGKDVYGKTLIADLSEMPHLLIAGTTGSGKSVCINCLLLSLLFRFRPDELRLILIDPKQVEMQMYNAIPHLVVPVVTDPKKVLAALRWVIREMEERYRILAKVGVRNIHSFNRRRLEELAKKQKEAGQMEFNEMLDSESNGEEEAEAPPIQVPRDDELHIPDHLPYIVVVVDELADLMQTAPADVENAVARLTAKARAAGIHLVVATQTPRREVVTGVIKTNIPSRIAFQVPSALDSRVILDENGAENLLGKGDLLYLPPGSSKMVRGQGAFVSDEEAMAVIEATAAQASPQFDEGMKNKLSQSSQAVENMSSDDMELLQKCFEVIQQDKKASTSMLQRRLRLGYNRAAWVMDQFQELGIISPPDPDNSARPREILVDLETYELPEH